MLVLVWIFRLFCAICFALYCPINGRPHHYNVVSFASEVDNNLCLSVTTALLSGWNYNLLLATPTKNENAKNMKVEYYKNYVDNASLPENDILVLADAYDVVYQRDVHHFMHKLRTLLDTTKTRDVVYFMAEKNCWPAMNPKRYEYYCPMAQGHAFYQNKPNHTAINCRKQLDLAPSQHASTDIGKFLNSGVCVGSVRALRKLFSDYVNLRDSLLPKCHDDQGDYHLPPPPAYRYQSFLQLMTHHNQTPRCPRYHFLSVCVGRFGDIVGLPRRDDGVCPHAEPLRVCLRRRDGRLGTHQGKWLPSALVAPFQRRQETLPTFRQTADLLAQQQHPSSIRQKQPSGQKSYW